MTDIAVLGAEGRMGQALLRALPKFSDAHLRVALTLPTSEALGQPVAGHEGVVYSSDIRAGLDACDVLIDFSGPQAAIDTALAMHQTRCRAMVTGTTGYSGTEEAALLAAGDSVALLKSGNFSLGVNMLEGLVRLAAERLDPSWDIEILDIHHRDKVDAPSGTAIMLGRAAAEGRGVDFEEVRTPARNGVTGRRASGTIGIAALRGGHVIGQHDVLFASDTEVLTLSHSATDRAVFAEGAIRAALWLAGKPNGLYDMKDVLGLKG